MVGGFVVIGDGTGVAVIGTLVGLEVVGGGVYVDVTLAVGVEVVDISATNVAVPIN